MTVWIVEEFTTDYSLETAVRGVFSTREKADAYITNAVLTDEEKLKDSLSFDISEFIIDEDS